VPATGAPSRGRAGPRKCGLENGATQGAPEQTSITEPPIFRNSDFWFRPATELRGSECGSAPVEGAVFVIGGVAAPLSQMISAEPLYG
jgi:hypothetical protein